MSWGKQRDLPETNPVNKADSRASRMRAVMSASRTLASLSIYSQLTQQSILLRARVVSPLPASTVVSAQAA